MKLAYYLLYTRLDHKQNKDIMQELQFQPIIHFINTYQCQWKKHIQHMDPHRISKAMLCYFSHGKRSLGHPKRRWTDNSSLNT